MTTTQNNTPAGAPSIPDAEERLSGLVILLEDIAASIGGVRALVRDLETLNPGHGRAIADALAVAGFLADFGTKYATGAPSGDVAPDWMLSDRAMRAGVAA